MSLVPSLLQAIVRVDGEALVLHAGDKPYVVSPSGQAELSSSGLTLEAVNNIVNQVLPPALQQALEEFGAVSYELPALTEFPNELFTIVVARGGDDVWAEIRRRRVEDDDRVPDEFFGSSASAGALLPSMPAPEAISFDGLEIPHDAFHEVDVPAAPEMLDEDEVAAGVEAAELEQAAELELVEDGPKAVPYRRTAELEQAAPRQAVPVDESDADAETRWDVDAEEAAPAPPAPPARQAPPPPRIVAAVTPPPPPVVAAAAPPPPPVVAAVPRPPPPVVAAVPPPPVVAAAVPRPPPPVVAVPPPPPADVADVRPPPQRFVPPPPPQPKFTPPPALPPEQRLVPPPQRFTPPPAVPDAPRPAPPRLAPPPQQQPGVVLPLARSPIRPDQPPPTVADQTLSGLDRLLRLSAARGASTLYLSSGSRSSVRVDGELHVLEGEPVLTARDVESLLLTLMPERSHEALRTGAATEWICDIEDVGRVRCMSFRDHRGPGGVFRLMPTRSVSAEQLGLPPQVQSLAMEPEGLVLVTGPRSSGKRTLISAFVDLMNKTRRDHVITIEREINIVHERGNSFISQREVRGNDDDMLAAARAALREDPDVLVIEDLRTGALMNVALEAAASGHLVIGGFSADTATGAIDRIIDLYAPEDRRQVQIALAASLRGIIAQVLLRKTGGGRLPAREVLLNTPAVSSLIAEGKTSQLPMAIEGGRPYGMMPLNDTLVGLVQSGAVDGREAYRQSPDRPGFLAALTRQGVDTTFAERLG
jgi:twitching motility protein PilT